MRRVRAISPVIAEIIIVAIAIAISIAVAGWLMGLWGGYTRTEQLQIISAQSTVTSNGTFTIVVKNTGDVNSKIIAIKIGGVTANALSISLSTANNNSVISTTITLGTITVNAGSVVTVSGSASGTTFAAGQTVTIVVVTESGKQFNGVVTVSA